LVEDIGSQVNEESLNHLAMIKSRAKRAMLLVSDLLLYSRIGNETEEYELIDFKQAITHCVDQKNADTFQLDIDGCDLTLPKKSFIAVLVQLISNVVKHHSTDSGKISVKCKKLTHTYQIEVSDDGPGINPRDHEKVFKKFQTLKSRDEVEGSGMGLPMVEKILSMYAAKISLVSDGQSGSTFIIDWPFDPKLSEQE
jgi:signal transduction histidine kinase